MSLAEALATSFMLLLVLSLVASLANEYARAMSFSAEKDKVLAGARVVLDCLRRDIEAANIMDLSNQMLPIFFRTRQDLTDAQRLGLAMNPWRPDAPAFQQKIEYRVDNQRMLRQSTPGGEFVVASGVWGLSVTEIQDGVVQATVSFMDANRVQRSVSSRYLRRVGMEP